MKRIIINIRNTFVIRVKYLSNELLNWRNINEFKDYEITYLLYKEGKSIETIALIRNLSKSEVEKHIIKGKIEFKPAKEDLLLKIISMNKSERLDYINNMDELDKISLGEEIYKRYISFKNPDDRMILIWLIGELKEEKLLPFLRMELRSNNTNFRRLACSALGKIKNKSTKPWLEGMLKDSNPQVRQYASKALGYIGDDITIEKLTNLKKNSNEKNYVLKVINESIENIKKNY